MACGCAQKIRVGITINDILQDRELRTFLMEKQMISKQNFDRGDILAMMQYAACVDWIQLKNAFANVGVDMELNEIPSVAEQIRTGGDKAGNFSGVNGQPIYFDGFELVRKIRFTREQILNAQCTIEWD